MSKVHAVLLVPAEGDPHGLLAEGPCGARPPMVVKVGDRWYNPWLSLHRGVPNEQEVRPTDPYVVHRLTEWAIDAIPLPTALVLAWDGKPVPVLWDWSADGVRVMFNCVVRVLEAALGWSAYEDDLDSDDVGVLTDHRLPGTLVLLDGEGREVNHE